MNPFPRHSLAAALLLGALLAPVTARADDPFLTVDPVLPRPDRPELRLSLPMPVQLDLGRFEVRNADEDGAFSDGDEPYLFVVAILADGTTIDLRDLRSSRVRLLSPTRTHGNLTSRHLDRGDVVEVPPAIGTFDATVLPIRGLPVESGRDNASVGLLVVALDEDGTPTTAANAGRAALVSGLQEELDRSVRTLARPNRERLERVLEDRVKSAISDGTMRSWWNGGAITGVLDPDDFIAAQFVQFSMTELAAGPRPFTMNFVADGVSYRVGGTIRTR